MKLIVTEDKKFLRIAQAEELELEQLNFSLKKRIRGWFFNPLVKKKIWDGYVYFCKNNLVPIGLWSEVMRLGETYNFPVEIEGLERIIDTTFDEADFREWVEEFFSDHPKYKPRDYQVDSAVAILKHRLCTSEIATSAGKTLITFLVYGYLKHKGKLRKMLTIVPNTTLVMQMKDDWEEYNNDKLYLKIRQVYGGAKDNDPAADVIVGTFQSLTKKTLDYFKGIDVVFVDEAHQTKTTSIKNIIGKCKDSEYRFGLSGTVQEDTSADFTTIVALLGPMVKSIPPRFLFKEGYATPVKFKMMVLQYKNEELKEKLYDVRRGRQMEGSQILALEKNVVVQHKGRFKFILDLVSKTSKNTLVLFSNVKDQYGKKMYDWLRENTDKVCFYVDGSVSKEHRDFYKKQMEEGENRILIASFTTFSTGISIKNIHNIIFTESYKSEIIVKQSIGRGMRQLEGKDSFTIIDIVDDLSFHNHANYLYKHAKARLEFYKQYSSDIKIHKIPL
jgi:superfamily II DNA or RNA helicase